MKIQLCDNLYACRKPRLKKPILIEGIEVSRNRHGQLLVCFATKNHKYLNVHYGMSSSHVNNEHCDHGSAQGFEIFTLEQHRPKGKNFNYPEDSVTLYLIPENKEECEMLCGQACILPTKWSYQICIVPFKDFHP